MKKQSTKPMPMVAKKILDSAKKNKHWKLAFATAKHGQIVFMEISPKTNPKNEVGMEIHPFDQFILVVQGKGHAVLDKKKLIINVGDMIVIPQGTEHNVVNSDQKKPLKIVSFYSDRDIPVGSKFRTKKDDPEH